MKTSSFLSKEIEDRLTMTQVAERYGFQPSRSGFLRCPFHSGDHTASLKIYPDNRGWYCFGCGKGGGVVKFVMELYDLDFRRACKKLNDDFSLGFPLGKPAGAMDRLRVQAEEIKRRKEREEEEREEQEELLLTLEYRTGWMALRDKPEDQWTPLEVEAIKRLPTLEYMLDELADKRWKRWKKQT